MALTLSIKRENLFPGSNGSVFARLDAIKRLTTALTGLAFRCRHTFEHQIPFKELAGFTPCPFFLSEEFPCVPTPGASSQQVPSRTLSQFSPHEQLPF